MTGRQPIGTVLVDASFGERLVSYQQRAGLAELMKAAAPGEALLELTVYGQAYLQLRARNIIPVAVV